MGVTKLDSVFFQVTRERRFNMRKNTPAQPVATEAKFKFSGPLTSEDVVCQCFLPEYQKRTS